MLKVQIYKCICESWGFPWIYCRSVFLNYKILYYMFSVELIIFLGLVYVELICHMREMLTLWKKNMWSKNIHSRSCVRSRSFNGFMSRNALMSPATFPIFKFMF